MFSNYFLFWVCACGVECKIIYMISEIPPKRQQATAAAQLRPLRNYQMKCRFVYHQHRYKMQVNLGLLLYILFCLTPGGVMSPKATTFLFHLL